MIPLIATLASILAVAWILAYHRANGIAWTIGLAAFAAYLTWFTSVPLGTLGIVWAAVAIFGLLSA